MKESFTLEGFEDQKDFIVLPMDVSRVKSISAAAQAISDCFPQARHALIPAQIPSISRPYAQGIDFVVNNAAVAPDGFDYDVAQLVMDVNFYGERSKPPQFLRLDRQLHHGGVGWAGWVSGGAGGCAARRACIRMAGPAAPGPDDPTDPPAD